MDPFPGFSWDQVLDPSTQQLKEQMTWGKGAAGGVLGMLALELTLCFYLSPTLYPLINVTSLL